MSTEFAGSLRERITVERQAEARTAMGRAAGEWEPLFKCMAAIVPETAAGAEAEGQALSAMARFRVTIRARCGVAVGQRIVWGGTRLMVRQVVADPRTRDRIAMRCEEVR
jgi:head-tail adaptor